VWGLPHYNNLRLLMHLICPLNNYKWNSQSFKDKAFLYYQPNLSSSSFHMNVADLVPVINQMSDSYQDFQPRYWLMFFVFLNG